MIASALKTILIVNRVGFIGGAEKVLLTAAETMRSRGHRVVLASPNNGTLATEAAGRGIEIQPIGINRTQATLLPRALLRQLADYRRGSREILEIASRLRP